MRAKDFIEEVGQIAAKSDSDLKDKPLEAACWYIAYREAEMMLDSSTLKEWARSFVEGIGPYKELTHVQQWLDTFEPESEFERDIKPDIMKFFGVKEESDGGR